MRFFLFLNLLLMGAIAQADLCSGWSNSKKLGELNFNIIDEASGLALSWRYKDRFYHINDSGDGPYFYQTNQMGGETKTITLSHFTPKDVEDLTYGPCFGEKHCLIIGDIGDNAQRRSQISFVFVEEKQSFSSPVSPLKIVQARYPDRAHNAEGLALHPNGDLYILTKEADYDNDKAFPAQIFKLTKEQIQNAENRVKTLVRVGEIDLPKLLRSFDLFGQIVTAFDISSDGKKFILLTYRTAMEVNFDLNQPMKASKDWIQGVDYNLVATERLPQQEAIVYSRSANSFYYNTEYHKNFGAPPIYQKNCEKPELKKFTLDQTH